ncbi:hypothetical protein ABK040_005548 [Willaertia magna]
MSANKEISKGVSNNNISLSPSVVNNNKNNGENKSKNNTSLGFNNNQEQINFQFHNFQPKVELSYTNPITLSQPSNTTSSTGTKSSSETSCKCKSGCKTRKCPCVSSGKGCSSVCKCKECANALGINPRNQSSSITSTTASNSSVLTSSSPEKKRKKKKDKTTEKEEKKQKLGNIKVDTSNIATSSLLINNAIHNTNSNTSTPSSVATSFISERSNDGLLTPSDSFSLSGELSSSPFINNIMNNNISLSNDELLTRVFDQTYSKDSSIYLKFKCNNSLNNNNITVDEELIQSSEGDDQTILLNGNKLFHYLTGNNNGNNINNVISSEDRFYQFAFQLYIYIGSQKEMISFQDFISIIDGAISQSLDPKNQIPLNLSFQLNISNKCGLDFEFNESEINVRFQEKEVHVEIAKYLYFLLNQQSEVEEEEIKEEEESTSRSKENEAQVPYEIILNISALEGNKISQQFLANLDISISKEYENVIDDNFCKSVIVSQLYIKLLDIQSFVLLNKDLTRKKIECNISIPLSVISLEKLKGKIEIKLASRHVHFEQRVISFELFKRLREIIGEERCKQFTELSFLICSPNQNTLWDQNVKRLKQTELLPFITEKKDIKKIAIKYFDKHIPHYQKFRERVKKESSTLFVVVADECHYAITKEKAHDKIVNDSENNGSILKEADNLFVLLVSATPYNVLSIDSNIPERYIVKNDLRCLEDSSNNEITISKDTIITVHNTNFKRKPIGYLIKQSDIVNSNIENNEIYFITEKDKNNYLQTVEELGYIKELLDKGFEVGELILREKGDIIKKVSDPSIYVKYKIEKRDNSKIKKSTSQFFLKKALDNLKENTLVELYDSVRWEIFFKKENDTENKIYKIDDWNFRRATLYEELNVISWNTVQKNTELKKDEEKPNRKKYFSKQDYVNTITTDNSLIKSDKPFEQLLGKVNKVSMILRPLLLAMDYHFWLLFYLYLKGDIKVNEFYTKFIEIDNIKQISKFLLPQITLSKVIYLFNFIITNTKGQQKSQFASKLNQLSNKSEEKEDDKDYIDPSEEKETSSKKEKKEQLIKFIKTKSEEVTKLLKEKETLVINLFNEAINKISSNENNSYTKLVVENLLNSCKIEGKLKGNMKIIRITSQEYAISVYNMLKYSISQLLPLQNNSFILPDILIDTGEKALNLDQLSVVTRLKLAEKILSETSYKKFLKDSTKLTKDEKSLEYINLHNFPCILLLVQKGRQGDTFPSSFNCLDMRAKGDGLPNYSSFTQEFGRLCRYISDDEEKPIALVPGSVFKDLKKSSNVSDSYINTNMKLDKYIVKQKNLEAQKYWNIITTCRRMMRAVGGRRRKNQDPSPPSYDYSRAPNGNISQKETHRNRILLFAEPQIGKTDSFLHFLERLKSDIAFNRFSLGIDEEINDVCDNEDIIISDKEYSPLEWLLPYHLNIIKQKVPAYEELTPGKYGKLVLKTRKDIFDSLEKASTNWYSFFVKEISLIESLSLNSNIYLHKINELRNKVEVNEKTILTFDGRLIELYDSIHSSNSGSKSLIVEKGRNIIKSVTNTTKNNPTNISLNYLDNRYINRGLTSEVLRNRSESKVYQLVEYSMFQTFFPSSKPRFSIPNNFVSLFKFNDNSEINGMHKLDDKNIKNWIFMPSHNRSAGGLFFLDSMESGTYGQVIVVRDGEQFDTYVETLGNYFIIMSLPNEIQSNNIIPYLNENKLIEEIEFRNQNACTLRDCINGIGFARLAIQLLAFAFGLEFIWMIDDTCHHFEKIDFTNQKQKVTCSMFEVMKHIETIVFDEQPILSIVDNNTTNINPSNFTKKSKQEPLVWNDPINEFTSGKHNIAMIGIRKDGYRYNSSLNYHPFIQSHTICSFFLLNVRATCEKRAFFPARIYQEDIEFEYLCRERGLYCLKSQQYFLSKMNNPIKISMDNNNTLLYLYDLINEDQNKLDKICELIPSDHERSEAFNNVINTLDSMQQQDNKIIIFHNDGNFTSHLNINNFKNNSKFYFCFTSDVLKTNLKKFVLALKFLMGMGNSIGIRNIQSIHFYSPQNSIETIIELIIYVECN